MSDEPIIVGDKVTPTGHGGTLQGVVVWMFEEWAWVLWRPRPVGRPATWRLESLTKVEPVFEVGKTYRRDGSGHTVTVVGKRGAMAIGWSTTGASTGAPWSSTDDWREHYEEIES